MIQISVDATKTIKDLNLIKQIFSNQKKYNLFQTMSQLLLNTYWAETFDKEGARRGHDEWKPLDPIYSSWKAKKGKSTKPLILTGHLRGSNEVIKETNSTLTWGTKVPYAKYHQNGEGQPKREMLFITDSDLKEIGEFLTLLTDRAIKKITGV